MPDTQETGQSESTSTAETPKVHPLEPGGERFTEVYAQWKAAERALQAKDQEIAAMRQQAQSAAPPPQPFYTEQQLQSWVDAGQITQAKMAAQLAWQAKEQAKQELKQELLVEKRMTSAADEVRQYMDAVPALLNESSREHAQVKRIALDIADDLGRSIQDPVVQRRALREVYGSLDRVKASGGAVDHMRRSELPPIDAPGGGRESTQRTDTGLKGVPAHYVKHWERLNYTPEQMAEEAKWIAIGQARRNGQRESR